MLDRALLNRFDLLFLLRLLRTGSGLRGLSSCGLGRSFGRRLSGSLGGGGSRCLCDGRSGLSSLSGRVLRDLSGLSSVGHCV